MTISIVQNLSKGSVKLTLQTDKLGHSVLSEIPEQEIRSLLHNFLSITLRIHIATHTNDK